MPQTSRLSSFSRAPNSRQPPRESTVLIVGANLQAVALPEVDSVFGSSSVAVTYLVTNSVWHEARWEMGREQESADVPANPKAKKERDDTLWRMYVDHRHKAKQQMGQ